MNVLLLSDTHCKTPIVPKHDLAIHAGDLFNWGWHQESVDWLGSLGPVLFVPGNHDIPFEEDWDKSVKMMPPNVTVCNRDMIWWEGLRVICYGYTDKLPGWAFQSSEEETDEFFSQFISADIIVSHGPPYGILDKSPYDKLDHGICGSLALYKHMVRIRPRLVVCGHIHESRGQLTLPHYNIDVINTACGWYPHELDFLPSN